MNETGATCRLASSYEHLLNRARTDCTAAEQVLDIAEFQLRNGIKIAPPLAEFVADGLKAIREGENGIRAFRMNRPAHAPTRNKAKVHHIIWMTESLMVGHGLSKNEAAAVLEEFLDIGDSAIKRTHSSDPEWVAFVRWCLESGDVPADAYLPPLVVQKAREFFPQHFH